MPVFMTLTTRKEADDFAFLARSLKESIGAKPEEYIWCVVADSDAAQRKGLNEVHSKVHNFIKLKTCLGKSSCCSANLKVGLFDEQLTKFIPCELHMRTNVDDKLAHLKFSKEQRSDILIQIFGRELPIGGETSGRIREGGQSSWEASFRIFGKP
ncbi:MAG: hypothetical protein GY820_02230 [Gammaproteobacteria bacterium]|nr:hypothetical protein [Gammaproteobacteria bacterium]